MMNVSKNNSKLKSAAGFSVVEMLVAFLLVGIVTTIALTSFRRSNRSFLVAGATRTLSGYMEKARVDAIRLHGDASIVLNSETSYTVNLDFGGGALSSRTITLPAGTTLRYTLPPDTTSINPAETARTITYNWRGQTSNTVMVTLSDSTAGVSPSNVVIGPSGNVATDTYVTGPVSTPSPLNTGVTTTTGIKTMQ